MPRAAGLHLVLSAIRARPLISAAESVSSCGRARRGEVKERVGMRAGKMLNKDYMKIRVSTLQVWVCEGVKKKRQAVSDDCGQMRMINDKRHSLGDREEDEADWEKMKHYTALEGAAWSLINCLKWCHLSQHHLGLETTSLKKKKIWGCGVGKKGAH